MAIIVAIYQVKRQMKIHHLGYACSNIQTAMQSIEKIHNIRKASEVVYDPLQDATICMLEIEGGIDIELVCGESVNNILSDDIMTFYHTCYETESFWVEYDRLKNSNAVLISEAKPAIFFDNRLVCFFQTDIGVIEILESSSTVKHIKDASTLNRLNICALSNYNIQNQTHELENIFSNIELPVKLYTCYSDDIFQNILDPGSILYSVDNINVIFIFICFDVVDEKSSPSYFKRLNKHLAQLSDLFNIPIFILAMPSSRNNAYDTFHHLKMCISTLPNINLIDYTQDPINVSQEQIQLANMPYSSEYEMNISNNLVVAMQNNIDPPFKVIAVDADNTLWSGACAEQSLSEIQILEHQYTLQRFLIECKHAGFLICIISKNIESDVINTIRNHPNMILNMDHIIDYEINWDDKYSNLIKLSKRLNVSLDSFIFIDDRYDECHNIQAHNPSVFSIQFSDKSIHMIKNLWMFLKNRNLNYNRTKLYKDEYARKKSRDHFISYKEYLDNLNIVIDINKLNKSHYSRIIELSYRTTQFNSSNNKLCEPSLDDYMASNSAYVISAHDIYGDYGIIGFISFKINNNTMILDNLFLSCRSLNKGIEYAAVRYIANIAPCTICSIDLLYNETERNIPIRYFYTKITDNNYTIDIESAKNLVFTCNEDVDIPASSDKYVERIFNSDILINLYKLINKDTSNKNRFNNNASIWNNSSLSLKQMIIKELGIHGLDDDCSIFSMGATSLHAIKIASYINNTMGVHIGIKEVYENDTILKLHKSILSCEGEGIIKNIETDNKVASYSQHSYYILHKIKPAGCYNMPLTYNLHGCIDGDTLEKAFKYLIDAHPILKTNYYDKFNDIYIKKNNHIFTLSSIDISNTLISDAISICKEEESYAFDISNDILLKAYLIKYNINKYVLFINIHHIISDGWSENILIRDLAYFYNKLAQNSPININDLHIKQSYSDFVLLERSYLSSKEADSALKYYHEIYRNANVTKICYDTNIHQVEHNNSDAYTPFIIDENLLLSLKCLSKDLKVTLFNTFLALFYLLLSKYTNQDDILIGCPFWNRSQGEFENTVGSFANLVMLKESLKPSMHLFELILSVKDSIIDGHKYESIPFKYLHDNISKQYDENTLTPGIVFAYQTEPELNISNIKSERINSGYNHARFDIVFEIYEGSNSLRGGIYSSHRYSQPLIDSVIESFINLCSSASSNLNSTLNKINLLSPNIVLSNNIHICENKSTINNKLNRSMNAHPNHTAIVNNDTSITYEDLDKKSNIMIANLITLGVKTHDVLAIHLEMSADLIVLLVALVKMQVTYLPININHPISYINELINKSSAKFIVKTDKSIIPTSSVSHLLIDDLTSINHEIVNLPEVNSNSIMYIIYTTGTTGTPKGVEVSYNNFNNLITSTKDLYNFNSSDKIVLAHDYSFDVSQWEIWTALLNGSQLYLPTTETIKSPHDFITYMYKNRITILNQTPSAFQHLKSGFSDSPVILANLRLLIFAGELLRLKILNNILENIPNALFYNMYGITEVTVHTTAKKIDMSLLNDNINSIGTCIDNTHILILDDNKNIMPIGAIGEIYVLGEGVAKGYHNNVSETGKSFTKIDNLNTYKSGDLGRLLGNGEIEYIGRSDNQIKLRGYRVDLNNIQHICNMHPSIDQSVVIENNLNDPTASLVCFIKPAVENAYPLIYFNQQQDKHSSVKYHTLKNKLKIAHLNELETDTLYQEIFDDSEYIRNGIVINDSDVVFDVGANIGMFTLRVALSYNNVSIYSFEPIPPVYDVLKTNRDAYQLDNVKIFNYGISNESKEDVFKYFPNVSVLSSNHTELHNESNLMFTYLKNKHGDSYNDDTANKLIANQLNAVQYTCMLKRISTVITENNIKRIDLLKIDVEHSELSVLQSIDHEHWNLIKQIAVEVHNHDNRLNKIKDILINRDYSLNIVQHDDMKNTELYMIYAVKNGIKFNNTSKMNHAFPWSDEKEYISNIKSYLKSKLPAYMVPSNICIVDSMILNKNGKPDKNNLISLYLNKEDCSQDVSIDTELEGVILSVWKDVLNKTNISLEDNFFDIGGNSLLLMSVYERLSPKVKTLSISDLLRYGTVKLLANALEYQPINEIEITPLKSNVVDTDDIAIIGYSYHLPTKYDNIWEDLFNGICHINTFTHEQLKNYGCDTYTIDNKNYIPKCSYLDNIDLFDASRFNYTYSEALDTDPQQRSLIELASQAIYMAGYDTNQKDIEIGIYCSTGVNRYADIINKSKIKIINDIYTEKDYTAMKIAYKLNLSGPTQSINTACSTGLTCIANACETLLLNNADIMLAGASTLILPNNIGHIYNSGSTLSQTGECKPFDESASGIVLGSGSLVFVLKKLSNAEKDGDNIFGVIKGFGVNNDGNNKIGFGAPGFDGQYKCIMKALNKSKKKPQDIRYIETHGTGTKMGDQLELDVLESIYGKYNDKCYIGSSKANYGHTDTASGLIGLLKILKIFENHTIPPQINCDNPIISNNSSLIINKRPIKLEKETLPFSAALSSFGMGGSNVHIIIESYPKNKSLNTPIYQNLNKTSFWPIKQPCTISKIDTHIHEPSFKVFFAIFNHHTGLTDPFDTFESNVYDSITLIDMIAEFENIFNTRIDLHMFSKTNNILDIYQMCIANKYDINTSTSLVNICPSKSSQTILMIHPADGYIFHYENLCQSFKNSNVYAINNSVLNDEITPFITLDKLADLYLDIWFKQQQQPPTTICGWSFGGVIAQTMAAKLESRSLCAKHLILLDSWANFDSKFNDYQYFYDIYHERINIKNSEYKDKFIRLLWERVKLMINHCCVDLKKTPTTLFKADIIQKEYEKINTIDNGWSKTIHDLNIINISASHTDIIISNQLEKYIQNMN
jgi:amino acid adenylation domain-containing protein/FkbH-like protein/FkbM family methyltransferase